MSQPHAGWGLARRLALIAACGLPVAARAQVACCFPDGLCVELDVAGCGDVGGSPQPAGSTCLTAD